MSEEYDALVWNGTWNLVSFIPTQNCVGVSEFFELSNTSMVLLTSWL